MPFKESLNSKLPFLADPKDSELKFLHEKFLSMQGNGISQPKSHTSVVNGSLCNLLGNLIGSEVVSSMILQHRLPLHQWTHIDISTPESIPVSQPVIEKLHP